MSSNLPTDPKRAAVFVIVPAYNEAPKLASVLSAVLAEGYTVVVVDDGSTDGTADVARACPVYLLRHPINLGQGAALETGMAFARQRGASIAVHFDADGQHDARQISELTAPIEAGEFEVALGCRFLREEDIALIPAGRRFILRVGRFVSGLLTNVWLHDTHNGFRAFSRSALEKIRLRESGFGHATEILDQIRIHRLTYIEVPTTVHYSAYSLQKGQSSSNGFNIVLDLLMGKFFR